MALGATPATGLQNRRAALRLLARMDRMEAFAREYEQFDHFYPDLPQWELECQRRNFAETYRRLVGVHPLDRHQLRRTLQAQAEIVRIEHHDTGIV